MHKDQKLLYSIAEVVKATGISRTKIYQEINNGKIDARKTGRRTLIPIQAVAAYIENLPSMKGIK